MESDKLDEKHIKKIEKENIEIGTDVDAYKLDEEENGEKYTLAEEHEEGQDDTAVPKWPKYDNPA